MKFVVELQLGNEAMQTGRDVGVILHHVANHMVNDLGDDDFTETIRGSRLKDLNGNTIGRWDVVPS